MLSELYFCFEPLSLSALEASPETVDMLVTGDHKKTNGALSNEFGWRFTANPLSLPINSQKVNKDDDDDPDAIDVTTICDKDKANDY